MHYKILYYIWSFILQLIALYIVAARKSIPKHWHITRVTQRPRHTLSSIYHVYTIYIFLHILYKRGKLFHLAGG